jgi:DUF971 family protein
MGSALRALGLNLQYGGIASAHAASFVCDGRASVHIEIRAHKSTGYEVRVVDADGHTVRMFTYSTLESARKAARAWTAAYGNCAIADKTGVKE